MTLSVCPAATSKAPPERFWDVLTDVASYGDWVDARFMSADPSGPAHAGQKLYFKARSLGREWPVRIDLTGLDSGHRWIDMIAYLPFGIANHEHLTLTATKEGGTLVRFN